MKNSLLIVQTEIANVASLRASFKRLGWTAKFSLDPEEVLSSPVLVLPGVGSFGAGMSCLQKHRLDLALKNRLANSSLHTLCVCLGLHLLFQESEESKDVSGLGLYEGKIKRFPENVRSPQFGWNKLRTRGQYRFLQEGYYYFANSYRLPLKGASFAEDVSLATAEHGGSFVAAFEDNNILACQFHPELSGRLGEEVLAAWLESVEN